MNNQYIRNAQSCAAEARRAVQEFHAGVDQPDMELVLFFCSSEYNLDELADEMQRLFAGIQVVGCTTAGEIGTEGYRTHSLSGVSFATNDCVAVSDVLNDLCHFNMTKGYAFCQSLIQKLENRVPQAGPGNTFALLLIDGLSVREEQVAHTFQDGLNNILLVGGSAGDDGKFSKTFIYSNGRFETDCAALILINTTLPFRPVMTHHFIGTDERLVVTEADTAKRIVSEINGLPAAQEYARLLGVSVRDLSPEHFAASPVVIKIGGMDYVRSIQTANQDGSLTFYCAIEKGMVLRVAYGIDLVKNLELVFEDIETDIGIPQLIASCVIRKSPRII